MNYPEHQDFKVQRQNLVNNIRRQQRQAVFNKRRNINTDSNQLEVIVDYGNSTNPKKTSKSLIIDQQRRQAIQNFIDKKYFPQMFPQLVRLFQSNDIIQKHNGIIGIRKILSNNSSPPIHLVFQYNVLPHIIQCMKQDIYPHLKLEATWIISNMVTGDPDQVQALIQFDVIPILISFLFQNRTGIADQAIWAIGNFAGDSPNVRDKVIQQGGVNAVINFINNTNSKNNMIQAAWALSNLCRGTPLPQYEKVKQAIPVLCKIINLDILDTQNLADCLWAVSYGIQGPKAKIRMFLENKALLKVIQCSKHNSLTISSPALRILGTISTGNESQTQQLLDNNILKVFEQLLDSKKALVRRQVCWILSNIAAGTRPQVDQLISNQRIIDKILTLFQGDSSQVKREICYIFANICFLGSRQKLRDLIVHKQIMRYYGQCLLNQINLKLVETCLDTLSMLFDFGQKIKTSQDQQNFVIVKFISQPGVPEAFQKLNQIQSQKIYEKALKIYERYFDTQSSGNVSYNNMVAQI